MTLKIDGKLKVCTNDVNIPFIREDFKRFRTGIGDFFHGWATFVWEMNNPLNPQSLSPEGGKGSPLTTEDGEDGAKSPKGSFGDTISYPVTALRGGGFLAGTQITPHSLPEN